MSPKSCAVLGVGLGATRASFVPCVAPVHTRLFSSQTCRCCTTQRCASASVCTARCTWTCRGCVCTSRCGRWCASRCSTCAASCRSLVSRASSGSSRCALFLCIRVGVMRRDRAMRVSLIKKKNQLTLVKKRSISVQSPPCGPQLSERWDVIWSVVSLWHSVHSFSHLHVPPIWHLVHRTE